MPEMPILISTLVRSPVADLGDCRYNSAVSFCDANQEIPVTYFTEYVICLTAKLARWRG